MASSDKKPKRRFPWAILFWILVPVQMGLALAYSPLTAIQRVRVSGVYSADEGRIGPILEKLRGKPFAIVNPAAVEGEVLKKSEVNSASFSHNFLGSALLVVHYRTPVARLEGAYRTALDENGVAFQSDRLPENLPMVRIPAFDARSGLGIAHAWSGQDLVKIAQRVEKLKLKGTWVVEVQEDRSLCLNTGIGRAIFGLSKNLDEKLALLEVQLARDPEILDRPTPLRLVAPPAKEQADEAGVNREPIR